MSVNTAEFSAQLKGFEKLSRDQAVVAQRKVTLQILRGVILANPVDTGRMRAGWTASVGAPSGFVPPAGAASYAAPDALGADLSGLQFGQDSWVTNGVEYSGFVNDFHPRASGFVQGVVANVESAFSVGIS